MIRPRGTGVAAGFGAAMDMVFCPPAAPLPVAPGITIRVPQAPQNANPGFTGRPQLGQAETNAGVGWGAASPIVPAFAGVERDPATARDCAQGAGGTSFTVVSGAARPAGADVTGGSVVAPTDPEAAGVTARAARAGTDAGILGESFQGIPPFGFAAAVGGGVFAVEEKLEGRAAGSGGSMVRAVSSGNGSRETGFGSALRATLISFPQPKQNL